MSEGFYRPGDRLPDLEPYKMYGGMFIPEPDETVIDAETFPEVPDDVRIYVRKEVDRLLTERTLPNWPVYFMNGQWLVTYEWVMQERQNVLARTSDLSKRIFELESSRASNNLPIIAQIAIGLALGLLFMLTLSAYGIWQAVMR